MMTLSRALKEKKRLVGRINGLMEEVKRYNLYEKENPEAGNKSTFVDISKTYEELKKAVATLSVLKAKIAAANAASGITNLVYEMEEKKSFLGFLNGVREDGGGYRVDVGDKTVFIERVPQLDREFLKAEREAIQSRIEELQDMIDEKNATVKVDFEL